MTKDIKETKNDKKGGFFHRVCEALDTFLNKHVSVGRFVRLGLLLFLVWGLFEVIYRYLWPVIYYVKNKYGIEL